MSARFLTGAVTEIDAAKGAARVYFADVEITSYWLPICYPKTQDDKCYWMPDVGEQVRAIMDEHLEDGSILGAVYSAADAVPWASANKAGVRFKDGGEVVYDRASGKLSLNAIGDLAATVGGNLQATISGTATIESGGDATFKAPKVLIDAPEAECTGNLKVSGQLAYAGGLVGLGGGAGAAASISQLNASNVDTQALRSATPIDDPHTHTDSLGGQTSEPG